MNVFTSLLKNIGLLSISAVINIVSTLAYTVLVSRYLGPSQLGTLISVQSFSLIWSYLGDLGMDKVSIRDVAQDPARFQKYAANLSMIRLLLNLLAFAGVNVGYMLVENQASAPERLLLFLLSASLLLKAIPTGVAWGFQALNMMQYEALQSTVSSIGLLGSSILVVLFNWGLVGLGWTALATSVISAFTILSLAIRRVGFHFRLEVDLKFWKTFMIASLPFALLYLAPTLYLNIDKILLRNMIDSQSVGLYAAASKIVTALKIAPTIYIAAIFPLFSGTANDETKFNRLLSVTFYHLILLSLPICAGVTILAPQIIALFYGPDYTPSALALGVAIWAFFFATLNGPLGYALISRGMERVNLLSTYLGLAANITCNVLLIPRVGYMAPAISIVISEFVTLIPVLIALVRKLNFSPSASRSLRVVLSCSGMSAFTISLVRTSLPVNIIVSSLVYFSLLLLLGGITPEEKAFLKNKLVSAYQMVSQKDSWLIHR